MKAEQKMERKAEIEKKVKEEKEEKAEKAENGVGYLGK